MEGFGQVVKKKFDRVYNDEWRYCWIVTCVEGQSGLQGTTTVCLTTVHRKYSTTKNDTFEGNSGQKSVIGHVGVPSRSRDLYEDCTIPSKELEIQITTVFEI